MERILVALATLSVGASLATGAVKAAAPPPAKPAVTPTAKGLPAGFVSPLLNAPAVKVVPQGTTEVTWPTLKAYEYQPGMKDLPDAVRALHGKKVVIRGFLMPLTEWDDIHEFSLVGSHMSCCFGVPPGFSGQVLVRIASARGLPNTNEPLEVTGTFQAKEIEEQGYVLAIYSITDAEARIVGY